ncbi:peptidylprolyl isomerase [bacterium]|nr:peptidylprolyl isomerase [bacterium]
MKKILLLLSTVVVFASCNKQYNDLGDGLFAEFDTNMGTMVVKLSYEKTPITVANFVALAEGNHPDVDSIHLGKPFYNGLIFHRVMDNFMIQGGDPEGTGRGGPGYSFPDEFDPSLMHDKAGILSMANSGPATNGSQFFITETPTPHLNNKHTVFGEVVLGLEIQDSISNVQTGVADRPISDVIIKKLNIIRNGSEANNFDAVNVWNLELTKLVEKNKLIEEEKRKNRLENQIKGKEKAVSFLPTLERYKSKSKSSRSGLKTLYLEKGNGIKPKEGDNVLIYYELYDTEANLIDSNSKEIEESYGRYSSDKEVKGRYSPMPMTLSPDAQMITGFKEAVGMMRVGDKMFAFLPWSLGYGAQGGGIIKPKQDLIFIITMVSVQ